MKRRDFVKILGVGAAGVWAGMVLVVPPKDISIVVKSNKLAIGHLVAWEDGTIGYVSARIGPGQYKVLPVNLKEPITEKHVKEMEFVVFANAFEEKV